MARALAACWVIAIGVSIAAPPAHAQKKKQKPTPDEEEPTTVDRRLEHGRQLFADLEYRRTIRTLQPIRTDQRATRAERLEALELIGLAYLIVEEEERAREAFEDLLAIDPGHLLTHDDGSPKIRKFFNEIKAKYVPGFDPNAAVDLEHSAPKSATAGSRLEIRAEAKKGAYQTKEMVLFWRQQGVLAYETVGMREVDEGVWRARFRLPASKQPYKIDYYIEARGVAGVAIGRVGGPEDPLSLEAGPGEGPTPWYRRWYVIAGGAAAVGIGTAALIFAASGDDAPEGTLAPGRITLTP